MKLPSIIALVGYAFLGLAVPGVAPMPSNPAAEARGTCGPDYYPNSDGRCVHRPTRAPTAPAGATARCRDGTYSFSQHRRGTCSHHGGVAQWL